MRRLLPLLLLMLLPLAAPAGAEPPPTLRAAPDEAVLPGDAAWPLGTRMEAGATVAVSAISASPECAPPEAAAFRLALTPKPGAKPPVPRACVGLTSRVRRNLHKTRALVLRIRADRPLAGFATISSANTERPRARDRHFGSFVIGPQWKTLRLAYGNLAPLPGWPAEAQRQGFAPGDLVLRPDNVEEICIGAEAGRIPPEGAVIEIEGLRFAP